MRTADSDLPQGVHSNLDSGGTLPTNEDDIFTKNGKARDGSGAQISVDIRHSKQDFESSDHHQALVSRNIQDFINDAEDMQPSKLSIVDEDLGGRRVMSFSEEESKKQITVSQAESILTKGEGDYAAGPEDRNKIHASMQASTRQEDTGGELVSSSYEFVGRHKNN